MSKRWEKRTKFGRHGLAWYAIDEVVVCGMCLVEWREWDNDDVVVVPFPRHIIY